MGALMGKRTAPDRTGYSKRVMKDDEDIIFELYDVHGLGCTEIADKFEVCPDYLWAWLRGREMQISKAIANSAK